jgi:3-phosphoshikimate 1-carboxyvinyltransferase
VPVTVREPVRSRDHTERMFRSLGVAVESVNGAVSLNPVADLPAFAMRVPGDASSAAFLAGVAVLAQGGALDIENVGLNPTRTGYLAVLERMGARFEVRPAGDTMGEPVGSLLVRPASLRAVTVQPHEVPALIDEIPLLAVLASRASGESVFSGVAELRVKESDRLTLLADNLRALGVQAEAGPDTLRVVGSDRPPRGRVETARDHRLAMAFSVLNTVPGAEIHLSERASVAVSYPSFFRDLRRVLVRG